MKNLDEERTPLKYQLGSNLSNIDKRSKQCVVNKAMKAIDTILEKIAPGQSSELEEECFQQQNRKDEESQLLGCLTQVLKEALNQMLKFSFYPLFVGRILRTSIFTNKANLLKCSKVLA